MSASEGDNNDLEDTVTSLGRIRIQQKEKMKSIKEHGIKNLLFYSQTREPNLSDESSFKTLYKKYQKMEKLLSRMRDPVDGVGFKDHKGILKVKPLAAKGSEIFSWLSNISQNRSEALNLFQILVDHGYLIPYDFAHLAVRLDMDAKYTFQIDYFYLSRAWICSEIDFAAYLLRASGDNTRIQVIPNEKIFLNSINDKSVIRKAKSLVGRQNAYLNTLSKPARRIIELRESMFWRIHRTYDLVKGEMPNILQLVRSDAKLKKNRMSLYQHFDKIYDQEERFDAMESHVADLKEQLNIFRVHVSAASTSLIRYCEVCADIDPFTSSIFNPWVSTDYRQLPWVSYDSGDGPPAPERVALWRASFKELLDDQKGRELFNRWLVKEMAAENLRFYIECEKLDEIQSRIEFYETASNLASKYIETGSSHELNINEKIRNSILSQLKNSNSENLDVTIFDAAKKAVFNMMRNDAYLKFINSDEIKGYLGDYQVKRTNFDLEEIKKNSMAKSKAFNHLRDPLELIDEEYPDNGKSGDVSEDSAALKISIDRQRFLLTKERNI